MYYSDYPSSPIGDGNPYYACDDCGISDPEINGRLEGHTFWCSWRKEQERKLKLATADFREQFRIENGIDALSSVDQLMGDSDGVYILWLENKLRNS